MVTKMATCSHPQKEADFPLVLPSLFLLPASPHYNPHREKKKVETILQEVPVCHLPIIPGLRKETIPFLVRSVGCSHRSP